MDKYVIDINIKDKVKNYDRFVLCSKKSKKGLNDNDIKVYIIENELVKHVCYICKTEPIWRKKPLDFILDRKNDIMTDNSIDNLRFLCPNCFSQIKKKKSSIFMKVTKGNIIKCVDCKKTIKASTTGKNRNKCVHYRCKSCLDKQITSFSLEPYMEGNIMNPILQESDTDDNDSYHSDTNTNQYNIKVNFNDNIKVKEI